MSATDRAALISVASVADMLAAAPANAQSWLSASEWRRIGTLRAAQRRQHYLAGHWLLRLQLARIVGSPVAQWDIVDRRSLPPLVSERPELHVSISHSGPWIACGVSEQPIGIDLEQRRDRRALAGFDQLLRNADEVPGSLDLQALLRRWVVKEAYIKRDCGSALPERLAELEVRVQSEPADLTLWQTERFLLGTVGAGIADEPEWPIDSSSAVAEHWQVIDKQGIRDPGPRA